MKAATRARQGLGVLAVARPDYSAQAANAVGYVLEACKSTMRRGGELASEAIELIPAPSHLRLPIASASSLLVVAAIARIATKAQR
eukprot:scaffold267480_cov36-Tisochrysis_lutea.AAC.3